MLSQGYWSSKAPLGYDQKTRKKRDNTTMSERQTITINEKGKLIRKAFYWKAEDKLTNSEIISKLAVLGLKLYKQQLSDIFNNPFYCGLMAHKLLDGQVVKGRHEGIVSKEIFLLANSIRNRNTTRRNDFSEVPLKNFMKCSDCGSSFCGYIVKKKGLWYYKCNKTGCKCNKSAKTINNLDTEKNTINEQLQRVTLNSVQLGTEKEQAISRIENLEKEVDKLVILKKTANAKFESLFIKTKTYRLSFNHKFGNTQLDGSFAELPDILKGATNIKFDGIDHIRSTTSNDILFSIKDIKLTEDERLLGFNLINYHNTLENIQFYLIRLGQIEQIGFAIFNGRAFHVTFKINEKLVQQ